MIPSLSPSPRARIHLVAALLLALVLSLPACGGQGLTVPVAFPPTIESVTPNSGLTSGGTPITVTGTNFTSLTIVTIGGIPCLNVVVGSPTSLTCQTPPGSQGAKDVTVSTTTGNDTLAGGFTYNSSPLTLAPGPQPVVDVFTTDPAGAAVLALADVLNLQSDGQTRCGDEPLSALAAIAAGAPATDMAEAAGVYFGLETEAGVLFWYADALSLSLGGFPDGWCLDLRLREAVTIDALAR